MRFKREVLHTISTQMLCLIFGVGISIILNRTLGPTLKGELVTILLIPQLVVSFINLGLGTAGSYFIAKQEYSDEEIVKTNLFAALLLGVIGIGIGWWIFTKFFPSISLLLKIILLSLIIWDLWLCYVPGFFIGKGLITQYNRWNLSQYIGKFLLIAIFFIIFADKLNGVIVAIASLGLISFLISFPVLSRWIKLKGKVVINFSYFKKGLNFGYKVFIANALAFLNYRFDILMLRWLSDATQVGYYSTAVGLVEKFWLIPGSISLVLYSKIVTHKLRDSKDVAQITRISLWIVLGFGIISIAFIKPIIILFYSTKFLPAMIPYLILLPGVIGLTVPKLLTAETVGGWGKPEISIAGMLLVVIVNIGLNFWLIPKLGMNGAALASTIAYIVQLIFFISVYIKFTHLKVKDLLLLKRRDICHHE